MKREQVKALVKVFKAQFCEDPRVFLAPGRINLLGEHTDYNDGFVMPAAIDYHILLAAGKRADGRLVMVAKDKQAHHDADMAALTYSEKEWPNYIMGVVAHFQQRGHFLEGLQVVLQGDIPQGAGLSSSAAIVSCVAYAINEMWQLPYSRKELAQIAQAAENAFVGLNCGIMDQFASLQGRKDQGFRLDCRSLEHTYFPMDFSGQRLLLVDSHVKHNLASSAYNDRRAACEEGVRKLQEHRPGILALRDATIEDLAEIKGEVSEAVYKCCKYVVEENERTLAFAMAMEKHDWQAAGALMFATHRGLSHLYQVSCPEMDFLVKQAREASGVLGARMMGGGFGGCMLMLVEQARFADSWLTDLQGKYAQRYKKSLTLYEVTIVDGVKEINV